MADQQKMRTLAREALKLGKEKAPAIVDERILPPALDEIAQYTGDLMGKLTNLDADDDKAITMAHGIIYDTLVNEAINQLQKTQLAAAGKRINKLLKK